MARLTRRALIAGAAALPFARPAAAQQWPTGRVTLVAPFPPGGSVDAISRLVQPGLQQRLGQPVIVENRSGGAGSIGANTVARAPPDGSTWLIVFDTHAVNPALIPNMPFDSERDLAPVTLIGTAPMVLACPPSRDYRTLADVIAAGKGREPPTYATIGNGSLGHLAMALLGKRAETRWTHVPYRGGGPAVQDALGGHVDLIIGSSALLASHINAGSFRPLAQTGPARAPTLGHVPTVAESGFPGFEANAWWGVFAPAATPQAIIARFRQELIAAIRGDERTQRVLAEQQQIHLVLSEPEAFRDFFREQMQIWGAVVRENGIRAD
jgi:tripartite-type tricarboxylate transporter receptor subunit TctC